MSALYPLRFQPIFRRYLWGGRRLKTVLGKPIGDGNDYAESWEMVDHGEDQSVVACGPLHGRTLGDLIREQSEAIFGVHHPQQQFPLLFKFLDAHRVLSVQVHPDDRAAALLNPPDLGKTEAWVVLHADPGSLIYAGLRQGVDRANLEAKIAAGKTEECVHRFEAKPGDCVFIPAGTVHAVGAGLIIAEIQQASDTTFRLFDWNRVGADGKPRPLHVDQGLEVIDFACGPVMPQKPRETGQPDIQRLVECEKFVLDRRKIAQSVPIGGDQRFHLLVVLDGEVLVADDPLGRPLQVGQTMLLPACLDSVLLQPASSATLLDIYLPALQERVSGSQPRL